eukprot:CAMPEP_0195055136 /NCGR_PEP_ID=MMETSP0448-20130528/3859_1 /TAXON_ID=66468 /ORGANISM="Heterocapsa triquestra, Strain CCMP 448" /LENGTH=334 /DNA_ID=CAMNT_0040084737 /DNA_START=133 /DNA_END=1137 /DNA_ORIENTATION=-
MCSILLLWPHLVQKLANHGIDCEGQANVRGHLDAAGDGAGKERGDAFILEHLHCAVQGALVELLGLLALHLRLHAILWLRQEDRADACHGPRDAVVDWAGLFGLVAHADDGEALQLQRHPHGLVARLLRDGRQGAAVQAGWTLALEDLHDCVTGATVVPGAATHVIVDARLYGLDRSDRADSFENAGSQSAQSVPNDANLALLIPEECGDVRVRAPPAHLLGPCPEDADAGSLVQPCEAVLVDGLLEDVGHAGVLRVGLGLELDLRLGKLQGERRNDHGATRGEALDDALERMLLLDESHQTDQGLARKLTSRKAAWSSRGWPLEQWFGHKVAA